MDNKLFKNYLYNVLYQVFILLTPLITTPYIAKVLGPTMVGINDFSGNIVQWFVLFGILGVNTYGNKKIAEVRDNKKDLSRTFFEIFAMQIFSLCLTSILYFSFVIVMGHQYQLYMLIQGITLLSVSLDITWFFNGVEDFKKASIRNIIVKIISIICIFTFIKEESDLGLFIFLNSITAVLGQFIMWVQLKQYIHFEKITLSGVVSHIKPNIAFFIPQIAISVYSQLDMTMLGVLYPQNISHVAYYGQAQKFVKMFLFFVTAVGSVMLPRIANTASKGDYNQIHVYLQNTYQVALYLSIPMIFGLWAVAEKFIGWFLPEDFSLVGFLIILTSPIILFISLSNVFGTQYMLPTGKMKQYTQSVVGGASINFILNLLLIPSLASVGTVIASVIAECAVTVYQYFAVRKTLVLNYSFKLYYKYLIAGAIMYVVTYFVGTITPNSVKGTCIQIVVGIVVYFSCLTILKDSFHKSLISKVLKRGG